MSDTVLMIAGHRQVELRVKGSRFLAEAFAAADEAEAEAHIAAVRRREYAATHHCTAYRVGIEETLARYDDDGEPAGTAGPPILRQIDGRGLTGTLVVVTRYFGGTKLGTGGLIRAYGDAAAEVLDACEVVEHVIRTPLRIRFSYDDTSPAMRTISQFDAEITESRYGAGTELAVAVRRSQVDTFLAAFIDNLGGRGEAEIGW